MTVRTVTRVGSAMALTLSMVLTGYGAHGALARVPAASGPDPQAALAALVKGRVYSTGPHGEIADLAKSRSSSPRRSFRPVKAMHATAAIALHYGGNDWSTAQVAGLQARVRRAGHQGHRRHGRQLQAG